MEKHYLRILKFIRQFIYLVKCIFPSPFVLSDFYEVYVVKIVSQDANLNEYTYSPINYFSLKIKYFRILRYFLLRKKLRTNGIKNISYLFIKFQNKCLSKYNLTMILLIFLLPGCHRSCFIIKKVPLTIKKEVETPPPTQPPPITVVIHGTKLFIGSFYRHYFDCTDSLRHASQLPAHKYSYKMLKALSACDPIMFPYEYIYYFGWSGLLSVKARDNATEQLYDALVSLSQDYYATYHTQPIIRLICHSHGASIGLSLARIHAQKRAQLSIDSLIMLACPVQWTISPFTHSSLFKNIYSFYASLDFIQVIAPEISQYIYDNNGILVEKKRRGYLFSAQTFKGHTPVKQARIKMYNRTIIHSDFMGEAFLCTLPQLMHAVDSVYAAHKKDIGYGSKEVVCSIL